MNIFKYIKYKKSVFFGFFTKTIEVIFELFLPIFMAMLMEQGLKPGGDTNKAFIMVGLILVFTFAGYLTTVYSQWLSAKIGQDYAKNLRKAIFHKVQDLSIEDTNNFSSSSLINRLSTDVSHMQNGLSMTIRTASRAPVMMIGSLIALFILNPRIAKVLLIGLPFVLIILFIIMKVSMKIFQGFQKENDRLIDIVKDNVEGARMIRAFAQVEHEENRFKHRNDVLSNIMIKLGRITSLSSPFTTFALNILLVVMLYIGAFEIFNSTISDTQLLQVINYTTQLTLSIVSVMNLALVYTRAYASAIRINEILDTKNSVRNEGVEVLLKETPAKIEFRNVSFSYGSDKNVLKNINLIINPGETVGIVGLTGSGKTSLVDLILRFYNVNSGEILINDININNYDIKNLRNNIAYASQKPALLAGTIDNNISMNEIYSKDELLSAINESQANFILNYDDKTNEKVLREGMNFSGGQRQRIALARALIKDAPILILDDVFSALDYKTDANIRKEINKREKKQTKIFISQRISSIKNADRIIIIDNGEIIDNNTHNNLLLNNELYKKLYETQVAGDNNDWCSIFISTL